MTIKFEATHTETLIILEIVERARAKYIPDIIKIDPLTLFMDIEACHCNGNPLRLRDLLNAPDSDFFHDITGIIHYIDRNTGTLTDFFSPRYSV